MCLVAILMLFSARLAGVLWWLLEPNRWELAFNGSWLWPVVGLIFLPWFTIMWVAVAPTGNPNGIDFMWLGLALLGDFISYSGSGYGNRDRIPGY
jgi:hypothetical protein